MRLVTDIIRIYTSKSLRMVCLLTLLLSLTACKDDAYDADKVNQQTIFVYMPWTADGLYTIFQDNLNSMESAIKTKKGLGNSRMLVYLSTSGSSSILYEFVYQNGDVERKVIKEYDFSECNHTTTEGITTILNDVKQWAPALNYAMMVGCHGSGWTYKDTWNNYPYSAKPFYASKKVSNGASDNTFFEWTRFFGSVRSLSDIATYSTDLETLADAIRATGLKMQYILFDDCYMANVEVAYELRDVTNFLIASTSEVMAIGMPYETMWQYLATATPNYSSAVNAFYEYYSTYRTPCGTIAAIDCRKTEALAEIMKEINEQYTIDATTLSEVQVLDGFSTALFYDMGDYVEKLCTDKSLLRKFNTQLTSVVPYKASTERIYSALYGSGKYVDVNTFSGITISDPSTFIVATRGKERTAWWQATH